LFEQALNAQALRLAGRDKDVASLDRSELTVLKPEDFVSAARALGQETSQEERRAFWRRR
jgi:hypothetical protein